MLRKMRLQQRSDLLDPVYGTELIFSAAKARFHQLTDSFPFLG